jgi:hypothetical protein
MYKVKKFKILKGYFNTMQSGHHQHIIKKITSSRHDMAEK